MKEGQTQEPVGGMNDIHANDTFFYLPTMTAFICVGRDEGKVWYVPDGEMESKWFDKSDCQLIVAPSGHHLSNIITDPPDKDEVIKHQDEIIGRLTRESEWLKDTESKRQEWLREAKKEAGFHDNISFDDVWKAALSAYKSALPHAPIKTEGEDESYSIVNEFLDALEEVIGRKAAMAEYFMQHNYRMLYEMYQIMYSRCLGIRQRYYEQKATTVTDEDEIYDIEDIDTIREMLIKSMKGSKQWCKMAMDAANNRIELQNEIKNLNKTNTDLLKALYHLSEHVKTLEEVRDLPIMKTILSRANTLIYKATERLPLTNK